MMANETYKHAASQAMEDLTQVWNIVNRRSDLPNISISGVWHNPANVSEKEIARRRKKNKQSKQSRKRNRK